VRRSPSFLGDLGKESMTGKDVIAAVETAEATNCRRDISFALVTDFLLQVATTKVS
jgi:hypothetical protein